MRLRQVALVARGIAPVARALETVFGLKTAFRDPAVGVFGLANVVMPVGGEFLEVLEPIRPGTAGGRYLDRRGGDAGYMVILQDEDALDHRARLAAAGVRVIAASGTGRYRFTHFHPADCAGVLLSIDSVVGGDGREPLCDWPPAGPDWRDFQSDISLGVPSATIQANDPEAAAARWSELLERPNRRAGDAFVIPLDRGTIRFVAPVDAEGTGVVGLDIRVIDPDAALVRAKDAGLLIKGGAVRIGGVAIRPVA
jgi:hypothetical protein